ncbi:MAG TPA: hypothetical protein PK095_04225 [Myxococcota bacterium]|nr:hypothetical protein [Myxococcota bacterium]
MRISLDGAVTHTVTPPGELSLPWREANGELRADVSAGLGLTRHLIDPGTGSLTPAPDASSKWEDVTTDMITTTLLLADGTRVLVTKPVGQDTTSLTKTNDKGENLWSVTLDGKQLGAAFVATLTSEGLALGSRPETSDGSTAPFRIVRMR